MNSEAEAIERHDRMEEHTPEQWAELLVPIPRMELLFRKAHSSTELQVLTPRTGGVSAQALWWMPITSTYTNAHRPEPASYEAAWFVYATRETPYGQ